MMIAKKGDIVIYTGDTSYAKDIITKDIMNKDLIIGEKYIIDGYTENEGYYKNHYIIMLDKKRGLYAYIPVESFEISCKKEFFQKRYNLK